MPKESGPVLEMKAKYRLCQRSINRRREQSTDFAFEAQCDAPFTVMIGCSLIDDHVRHTALCGA
jgi:hypothetical protein